MEERQKITRLKVNVDLNKIENKSKRYNLHYFKW